MLTKDDEKIIASGVMTGVLRALAVWTFISALVGFLIYIIVAAAR